MPTPTVQPLYAASTPITCTLASLAASSTVGRSSTVIDNTTNKYLDAEVTVGITTGSGALGGSKTAKVYLFASEDGTNFEQEEGVAPGTDAGYTINSPTIFRLAAIIPVANISKYYARTFKVAQFYGGRLPRKWGIIVINDTGATLAASGNLTQYTGINDQIPSI